MKIVTLSISNNLLELRNLLIYRVHPKTINKVRTPVTNDLRVIISNSISFIYGVNGW